MRRWKLAAHTLHLLLVTLSVIGIVCALAVTGFVDYLGVFWTRVLAFISAVCFSLIPALNLTKSEKNFLDAWRRMRVACEYYWNLESYTIEQLIKAYAEAESIIDHLLIHLDTGKTKKPPRSQIPLFRSAAGELCRFISKSCNTIFTNL